MYWKQIIILSIVQSLCKYISKASITKRDSFNLIIIIIIMSFDSYQRYWLPKRVGEWAMPNNKSVQKGYLSGYFNW